jgi:hypothetical protein
MEERLYIESISLRATSKVENGGSRLQHTIIILAVVTVLCENADENRT